MNNNKAKNALVEAFYITPTDDNHELCGCPPLCDNRIA